MMGRKIIDEAAEEIAAAGPCGEWIIHNGGRTRIDRRVFSKIPQVQDAGRIAFIDGGNAPIMNTPSQSCHLCRTASLVFCGGRRERMERNTFIAIARCDGALIRVKTIGSETEIRPVNTDDEDLRVGRHKASAGSAVELARQTAEIEEAKAAAAIIGEGGLVIMDGDLGAAHPILADANARLEEACKKAGATRISLAKTNTAVTETGHSAAFALMEQAPQGTWAYRLESNDGIHRAFAKLHKSSRHCFLIESRSPVDDTHLARIAAASSDLAFLGYPHGLIAADSLARITNQERDCAAIELASKIAKRSPEAIRATAGSDAHSILDKMSY